MQKDIKLTGIGNGLVDILFEVEENDIIELGLNKGQMLLANKEQQLQLLEKFAGRKHHKFSGGSAANTIIAFAKFGGKAAYKTSLGNDELGKYYAQEFKDLGIILKAEMLDSEPTGTCIVLITPDSERTMHTCLGASSQFGPENIDEDIIKRSEWIYIEGYEFSTPNGSGASIKVMEIASKHDTKIALTFSDHFITQGFRDALLKVAQNSSLIFCNETEAMSFAQADNIEDAFNYLSGNYQNIAVTLGEKGSRIKWKNNLYNITPYPARPIDTTGAGDMYAAGFLYGIITTGNPENAGNLASLAAAKVVSQMGARLNENHEDLVKMIL